MASLSDQIDRLTRNTRNIKATATATANESSAPSLFTRAVLDSHIGDLIRDIDPSELGLFSLSASDKDPVSNADPHLMRTQFHGATPLRRHPKRQDPKQEIEPEIYAQAALKYIDQYDHIRPLPRAYDQIINILERLNDIRRNIEQLNHTLKQSAPVEDAQPIKSHLEKEERHIQDLQARIAELSKKKETSSKTQRAKLVRPKPQPKQKPEPKPPSRPKSPSSPQEAQFWSAAGDPGRTLRFADNLMDEQVDLQDVSSASFGSPSTGSAQLGKSKMFAEADSFVEEPTVTHFIPQDVDQGDDNEEPFDLRQTSLSPAKEPACPSKPPSPQAPTPPHAQVVVELPVPTPKASTSDIVDTPGARTRKVRVNRDVEKIVTKIWGTISDIIPPPPKLSSTSTAESISHLEQLASRTPQLESPIASSASLTSVDSNTAPSLQQVLTAHLLMMLLHSPPQYSLPLNQVKDGLSMKAKTSGVSVAGQGTTRVLYGCVAKRLVKIDRGGREQIVKFDI